MEGRKSLTTGHMDFPLLIGVLCICAFGLVMMFSASYYYAQTTFGDGYYFLKSQAMYLAVGVAGMLLISRFDYKRWDKLRTIALLVTIVLMALVLVIGVDRNGAQRWLAIGSFTIQPSELAKFAMILFMASFMARKQKEIKTLKKGIAPMALVLFIMCVFIILQRNLSMLIIVGLVWFIMLFLGGAQWKHLLAFVLICIPIVFLLSLEDYRWARVTIFTDPWKDAKGDGYQLIQSLYAIGSGGLFGKGLNFSRQKLLFRTYGESDFIFAIIAEELGFIGCVLVMAAYMFVIYRGVRVALRCKDRFGSLLAAGIMSALAVQVLVNIGVATSSIPPTGQTLPFISAGGTSLVIFLCAIGIVLNISKNTSLQ